MGVSFARLLVVHSAAEIWVWACFGKFGTQVGIWVELFGYWPPVEPIPGFAVAVAFSAAALLAFLPGRARLAAAVQAALMAAMLAYFFPNVPNHFVAFTIGLGLCAFCDPERESDLLVMGLRSAAALIVFGAGVQKFLYGTYFRGAVLAFLIAESPNFRHPFLYLLPAERLETLRANATGPYLFTTWLGLFVSNLTWLLEIVLPPGLLRPRLRFASGVGVTALVLAVQVTARELFFAGFMVPLLLLWVSPVVARRSIPVVYAMDAYLVLGGLGVLPYVAAI